MGRYKFIFYMRGRVRCMLDTYDSAIAVKMTVIEIEGEASAVSAFTSHEKRNRNRKSRKNTSMVGCSIYGVMDFGRSNLNRRVYAEFTIYQLSDGGAIFIFVLLILQE